MTTRLDHFCTATTCFFLATALIQLPCSVAQSGDWSTPRRDMVKAVKDGARRKVKKDMVPILGLVYAVYKTYNVYSKYAQF